MTKNIVFLIDLPYFRLLIKSWVSLFSPPDWAWTRRQFECGSVTRGSRTGRLQAARAWSQSPAACPDLGRECCWRTEDWREGQGQQGPGGRSSGGELMPGGRGHRVLEGGAGKRGRREEREGRLLRSKARED